MESESLEHSAVIDNRALWSKLISRFTLFFVLIVFLGFVYHQITQDDVLPVNEISVSGVFSKLNTEELKVQIADGVEGNFFTLSVSGLYLKLLQMPWVEQVWIHRVWPDKIKISVVEQRPVAIWKGKGLINETGELFLEDASGFEKSLPIFDVNMRYKQEVIRWYRDYETILAKYDLNITQFLLDDRKSQTLQLSNGIKLELGGTETAQRLTRFLKVLKSNLYREQERISSVDLRYSNGFSVAWNK